MSPKLKPFFPFVWQKLKFVYKLKCWLTMVKYRVSNKSIVRNLSLADDNGRPEAMLAFFGKGWTYLRIHKVVAFSSGLRHGCPVYLTVSGHIQQRHTCLFPSNQKVVTQSSSHPKYAFPFLKEKGRESKEYLPLWHLSNVGFDRSGFLLKGT